MSVRDDFVAGRPMAQPVIDVHTHLPPRDLFYRASGESRWRIPSIGGWQQHETCPNLAGIVRHMDRLGISNIAYARIPDEARRRILGINMRDVLTGLGYWDTWGYDAASHPPKS